MNINIKPYILCADDDVMNQIIIMEMLQEKFDLKCINTGQDCLDSVTKRSPDLILLGESMPIIDDDEMKKMLRNDARYKEIPIITLSGEISDKVTDIGFNALYELNIKKPFDEHKLLSGIEQLLSQTESSFISKAS